MPFVSTDDDCEIYYETSGSGAPVVFISGFMGITDIWREQVRVLQESYRCIAFDGRGAGRSDKPLPRVAYGVDRHAHDLGAVLDATNVDRAVLIGHSMGANIACSYALSHPERVAGIVFVGSYVSGEQLRQAGNTIDRLTAAISTKQRRIEFYTGVGLPIDIATESTKWPLYAMQGNAESVMAFDIGDRLHEITMPSLILHGDRDVISPLDPCGTALQSGLPNATLEVFEDVNHCPMMEAPDKTNALLEAFLHERAAW